LFSCSLFQDLISASFRYPSPYPDYFAISEEFDLEAKARGGSVDFLEDGHGGEVSRTVSFKYAGDPQLVCAEPNRLSRAFPAETRHDVGPNRLPIHHDDNLSLQSLPP
jgi:hypothetical protein